MLLVQYENEISGSLESRRKMEESGGFVDTKKTGVTAQLLPAKAMAALAFGIRVAFPST